MASATGAAAGARVVAAVKGECASAIAAAGTGVQAAAGAQVQQGKQQMGVSCC